MDTALIIPLRAAGAAPRHVVGSKAKELGRLAAEGLRVPEGFVVTTRAQALAASGEVPAELREALARALDELDGRLAYRSSAVAEDLGHASYAGQYETVLDVEGIDAGLAALRRCWDSAGSAAVERYRAEHGDADRGVAVLVQRMVPATAAGAAFSANPVTGADEVVIEAVPGVGESLMAGDVTPEQWVVGAQTRVTSPNGGRPALTEAQAAEIAAQCRAIAAQRGRPQDIEWAIDGEGLHLLQARPITALPVEPTARPPEGQTWVRADDYFPLPVKPLFFSAWLPRHSVAFAKACEQLGLPVETVAHGHFFGRVYDRVVPLGSPRRDSSRLPPVWLLKIVTRLAPPFRRRMRAAVAASRDDLPLRLIEEWESGGRQALRARTRALRAADRAAMDDGALAAHLDAALDQLLQAGIAHFSLALAGTFELTGELGLVMQELLDWPPARVIDLVQGHGAASVAKGAAVSALAAQLAVDPTAGPLLREAPERLLDDEGPGGAALRAFLDEHGHQLIAVDLEERTWAEDPAPLLRLLQGVAARRNEDDASPRWLAAAAAEEARAAIADADDRERFEQALARARRGRPYGDETEGDVGEVAAVVRYIALEAAERLAARAALADAGDVFYLTCEELGGALRGEPLPGDLARRRAEHRWALANRGPRTIGPAPGPIPPHGVFPAAAHTARAFVWAMGLFHAPPPDAPAAGDDGSLRGLAASPGRATGPARIIRSPEEFHRVQPGDVMVCPHTMAAWSPIFPLLGGLVTEHGGPLSHPATLAREYGLPAVLAVTGATERFADGQIITIDGGTGVIEL